MLERYKYTDSELKKILSSICLIVDRREQKCSHITDWFDKKKIKWVSRTLTNGDYSFFIPKNPELNIDRDLYFDKDIIVERKNSVDELAGNFTKNRTRFEEEMATFPGKKFLLIEGNTYDDIVKGNYRSEYAAKSYVATLHTFNHRYNLEIMFMPEKEQSGLWIYSTFMYWLRERLR